MFGHWSKRWREALLSKYKVKDADLHYFQVHEEADLHEHLDGLMAHGEVARQIFERLLQDGCESIALVGALPGARSTAASPMLSASPCSMTAYTNTPKN